MYEFPVTAPVDVDLRVSAGRCEIATEDHLDTVTVTVEPFESGSERAQQAARETTVQLRGGHLLVKTPDTNGAGWLFGRRHARLRITIRIPAGSNLGLRQASADLRCVGRLSTVTIGNASGDVDIDEITGDATVDTASGDVRLRHVGGFVKAHSASGEIILDHVGGGLDSHTASGDSTVGSCGGQVRMQTASGNVRIGTAHTGAVRVGTASGDVAVGVPAGTGVWLDLNTASGATTSDLSVGAERPLAGHDLELRVTTASGDIEVFRVPV